MATTPVYTLQPVPKWYIANNLGRPLAPNGYIFTYRSLDKTEFKFAFQDAAGQLPWTDPIPVDANGSVGPIFWEFDPLNPDETYYIRVCNSNDPDDLLWDFDGLSGSAGSGGGTITTFINLENFIVNNVFWRNINTSATPVPTFLTIAPGAHAGLALTAANFGPDITFIKNTNTASDTITFIPFSPGDTPFSPDPTPVDYLNYNCTNSPTGETAKYVQIPLTAKVENLSSQALTFTIWARLHSGSGGSTLRSQLVQFYGDGPSASSSITTVIQDLTLTTDWQQFTVNFSVPDASGTEGECGNSGLFLQLQFPLNTACNIDLTKPSIYLGNNAPSQDYQTYDMIDGVINVPRTGDTRTSFNSATFSYLGFILMNDTSIGSTSSIANYKGNITFPLYNLLWNNISNTFAPVSGGRGASAVDDFVANKTLTLPSVLGRALASAGSGSGLTTRALGEIVGEQTHVLTIPEMPSHDHSLTVLANTGATIAGGAGWSFSGSENTTFTGGGGAHNNMQPTSFMNVFIKL